MFKKTKRLTQSEFSQFFAGGKRHHSKHTTIITHPHGARKVAVVVGKKVTKSAVRRNLLKRRVYATLRQQLADHPYQGVLIVLAKPSIITLSRKVAAEELTAAVAQALKNA